MRRRYIEGSRLCGPGRADEWALEEELGRGESGSVYRATRVGGVEESAVKVIVSFLNHDGDLEELVKKERRAERIETILKKVKNMPYIVKYEDCFRLPFDDERPEKGFYLIIRMEKLTPLKERVKAKPMDARGAAKLGYDICSALEACEKSEIIHRDIKPANILVTKTGGFWHCSYSNRRANYERAGWNIRLRSAGSVSRRKGKIRSYD